MKIIVAGLVALAMMTTAVKASVLTFVLSLNDNGAGVGVYGTYSIYAFTSAGDNAGLASFTITVTGQTSTVNRSPQATFAADDGVSDSKTSGFSLLRSAGSAGTPTTGSFDTVSGNGIVVYGIGQVAGNVRNSVPAGYTATSTVAQGAFGVSNTFTTGTIWSFISGPPYTSGGQVPVLLATGIGTPTLTLGSGNLFTGNGLTVAPPTSTFYAVRSLPDPAGLAVLGLGGVVALFRRR